MINPIFVCNIAIMTIKTIEINKDKSKFLIIIFLLIKIISLIFQDMFSKKIAPDGGARAP